LFRAAPQAPRTVAYIPYALKNPETYIADVKKMLAPFGIGLVSLHGMNDPAAFCEKADGVFMEGGNTFRLLDGLQKTGLLDVIREKAGAGMPYLGISAGISVAGPTIRTTNDPPIVEPASFSALGLVPFQLSPHYVGQDARIAEFHEENAAPVLALRDGSALRVGGGMSLLGGKTAMLFERGRKPVEITDMAALRLRPAPPIPGLRF
jgi:dipeptidase E